MDLAREELNRLWWGPWARNPSGARAVNNWWTPVPVPWLFENAREVIGFALAIEGENNVVFQEDIEALKAAALTVGNFAQVLSQGGTSVPVTSPLSLLLIDYLNRPNRTSGFPPVPIPRLNTMQPGDPNNPAFQRTTQQMGGGSAQAGTSAQAGPATQTSIPMVDAVLLAAAQTVTQLTEMVKDVSTGKVSQTDFEDTVPFVAFRQIKDAVEPDALIPTLMTTREKMNDMIDGTAGVADAARTAIVNYLDQVITAGGAPALQPPLRGKTGRSKSFGSSRPINPRQGPDTFVNGVNKTISAVTGAAAGAASGRRRNRAAAQPPVGAKKGDNRGPSVLTSKMQQFAKTITPKPPSASASAGGSTSAGGPSTSAGGGPPPPPPPPPPAAADPAAKIVGDFAAQLKNKAAKLTNTSASASQAPPLPTPPAASTPMAQMMAKIKGGVKLTPPSARKGKAAAAPPPQASNPADQLSAMFRAGAGPKLKKAGPKPAAPPTKMQQFTDSLKQQASNLTPTTTKTAQNPSAGNPI